MIEWLNQLWDRFKGSGSEIVNRTRELGFDDANDFVREPNGIDYGLFSGNNALFDEVRARDVDETVADWLDEIDSGGLRR